jgi:hypothetical protein
VSLSSTEADYFATSKLATEFIFSKQVVEPKGIAIAYPIEIKVGNTGAIYIANNYTTGQRTKNSDFRAHFVQKNIAKGILKVVFESSDDNDAESITKNMSVEVFLKHSGKNMEDINSGD